MADDGVGRGTEGSEAVAVHYNLLVVSEVAFYIL